MTSTTIRILSGLLLFVIGATVSAEQITMDFEKLYDSGEDTDYSNQDLGKAYFEEGMRIRSINGEYGLSSWYADVNGFTGSTSMFNNTRNATSDLRVNSGGTFDLLSIDLAPLHGSFNVDEPVPDPEEHTYVTFYTDTGHSQTFDVGSTDAGWVYDEYYEVWRTTAPPPVTTFYFDEGFHNVNWVQWVNEFPGPHQFDNIVVNVVPIPAAVWLFGSALAGLGWMRGRRLRNQ